MEKQSKDDINISKSGGAKRVHKTKRSQSIDSKLEFLQMDGEKKLKIPKEFSDNAPLKHSPVSGSLYRCSCYTDLSTSGGMDINDNKLSLHDLEKMP